MELLPTLIATGWASGVNAYATLLVLGIGGRAGLGVEAVPEELTTNPVLIAAGVMYAIEFVADKIPIVDSVWDIAHTLIRPFIGGFIGVEFASADNLSGFDQALAGGGTGALALASHGVKASFRLGLNASPEPFTNIGASIAEDFAVAAVTAFALEQPEIAAVIAIVLLLIGICLVILVWKGIRKAWPVVRERWRRYARRSSPSA